MNSYLVPAPDISEEDTLIYYNGTLLALATIEDYGNRVLAIALMTSANKDPFLLVEITPEQERRLLDCTVTLRALCLECMAPQGLGAYLLSEFYEPVWELTVLEEISEQFLPGDVTLKRMP